MTTVRRGWFWLLDYVYVGFWQVHGFLFRADPADYLDTVDQSRRPVLLLPGIYERWQFLRPLADRLQASGHPVHVVTALGWNRGPVEEMAQLVEYYLTENGLQDMVIVTHSKGGLIGKRVMSGAAGERITAMAAINTPFAGSVYARLFPLSSIRAFLPSNPALRSLAAEIAVNSRITSIYSAWDPHIPGGSYLNGGRNIQIRAIGHFRIVADKQLQGIVRRAVEGA